MKPVIFFDADDTLWSTAALYHEVKQKYEDLLRGVGIDDPKLLVRLDELDVSRVPMHGFTIDRFIGSMILLYEQLSLERQYPVYLSVVERIKLLGETLRQPPVLFDDTIPVLTRLSESYRLVLVTAGDYHHQTEKVRATGVAHFFRGVRILPVKTVETVAPVVQGLGVDPSECWFVGNSPRSDIVPALELGMKAILIKRNTWVYDEVFPEGYEPDRSRFWEVESLTDAMNIILQGGNQ